MTHAPDEYRTACVIAPICESKLAEIRRVYPNVLYRPDSDVSDEELREIDIWYATWTGLPPSVTSVEQVPRTKAIQLSSGACLISSNDGCG